MKGVFLILFFSCFFCFVSSLTCISNACELPEVLAECPPPPRKCPRGYALKPAGLCRCCLRCKLILYEGGNCTPEVPIAGAISDRVVCADGLQCINNTCQRICRSKGT
ncbi:hypothetical protein WA026_007162 [Henosepilachna vigintioctopunctata]|uniref:IGFBP N-terminal domain-containing protein n=1 Tax=Henosepilachna vigintioctopunctata TaxID=420089 RepID=A0AAW1V886_9CUCU